MSLLTRDVSLSYGRRKVVSAIDFTLETGDLVALLGPNGSGKSTLLRALGRLLRPSHGVVELDGRSLAAWPAGNFARRVALLGQTHAPVGEMTVRELIALGRHPHQGFLGLPTRRDADAIEAAIRLTGLGSAAGRMLRELSGGEQQRAWFALVLAQEPEILLLDEPTTFLDLANQMVVLELIEELNRLRRISVVMALHDLGQAARYARRLVLLRDGSVLAEGTAAEVLTKERIRDAYGVEAEIVRGASGVPTVVPLRAIRPA